MIELSVIERLLGSGKYQEVEGLLQNQIVVDPDYRFNYWYLGLAQLLQGEVEQAQETWWQGIGLATEIKSYLAELVEVLSTSTQLEGLAQDHRAVWQVRLALADLQPDHLTNLLQMIVLQKKVGSDQLSSPSFDEIKQQIGELLVTSDFVDLKLEELLEFLNEVLTPLYCDQAVLDLVEQLCLTQSHFHEQIADLIESIDHRFRVKRSLGILLLEMANRLNPNHHGLMAHLADFYLKAQDLDRALMVANDLYKKANSKGLVERLNACHTLLQVLTRNPSSWQATEKLLEEYNQHLGEVIQLEPAQVSLKQAVFNLTMVGCVAPYFGDYPRQQQELRQKARRLARDRIYLDTQDLVEQYQKRKYLRRKFNLSDRRLRIGFVSTCLRRHSVGYLARWFVKYLDREQFELFGYMGEAQVNDPLFDWYLGQFSNVHLGRIGNIRAITEQIEQDGIDILIDLDSITYVYGSVMLFVKPAPVQITWLGWDAAANDCVDYYIADRYVLPEEADNYYVEKIWRLPETYIAVDGFEVATPSLRRELLNIPTDGVIFYSAQIALKRHPEHSKLQLEILKQVPNSYLLIKGAGDQAGLEEFFNQLAMEVGVSSDRLRFLPKTNSEAEHRANYLIADVILDTYPYNGATHTLEALWLEIPIVTRVGEQFAARNGYTMLLNAGIDEGIAFSAAEYVAWGVRLGTDANLRAQVAWKLKQGKKDAPLWNAPKFTRQMEAAFNQMWQIFLAEEHKGAIPDPVADHDLYVAEAELLNREGIWFAQKHNLDQAIACWQKALELNPVDVNAQYNLATALSQSGQLDLAVEAFERVLELKPDYADAMYNLGLTLVKGHEIAGAVELYERALAIAPQDLDIYLALGAARFELREFEQAIACYEQVLELDPNSGKAFCGMGAVLLEQGSFEQAIEYLETAIGVNPQDAQAYCNLAQAFTKVGKMEDAAFCYARALELNPSLGNAYWNYNNDVLSDPANPVFHNYPMRRRLAEQFLASCYDTDPVSSLVNYINNYTQSGLADLVRERLVELESYIFSDRLSQMEIEVLYNNFLFTLSSLQDDPNRNMTFFKLVGGIYRQKIIKTENQPFPFSSSQIERITQKDPLRIGILSPHFGRHPVGWCSYDVIAELSKITPHIFLYNTGTLKPDTKTAQFEQLAEKYYWYEEEEIKTQIRNYEARVNWVARDIRTDQIDVLLDLDSITVPFNTHLLCGNLAPVNVSWLGFDAPFVSDQNYWLGDRFTHPTENEKYYLEKIIRLPDAHMAVSGFDVVPIDRAEKRNELGIKIDQIAYLFAVPGRKFNQACARACVQIIKQVPNSIILHKGMGDRDVILSIYHQECLTEGIDIDRVKYLPSYKTEEEHRAVYQIADVFLDAYPYNGGTHNIEALWSNLPVVTYAGQQSFARMGCSFINAAGIETGISSSWEEYVEWGVKYGLDQDLRLDVKAKLIKGKDPKSLAPLWNPQKLAQVMYGIFQELLKK
ncbi:MAG: tetratricopeptide repeat protein [Pseudanabaenaceae cyanobacterium bins.68]|nr:tetratricopeptide repeat protein [Pseudanabaenaceae cyanobacterium bins.68]